MPVITQIPVFSYTRIRKICSDIFSQNQMFGSFLYTKHITIILNHILNLSFKNQKPNHIFGGPQTEIQKLQKSDGTPKVPKLGIYASNQCSIFDFNENNEVSWCCNLSFLMPELDVLDKFYIFGWMSSV